MVILRCSNPHSLLSTPNSRLSRHLNDDAIDESDCDIPTRPVSHDMADYEQAAQAFIARNFVIPSTLVTSFTPSMPLDAQCIPHILVEDVIRDMDADDDDVDDEPTDYDDIGVIGHHLHAFAVA